MLSFKKLLLLFLFVTLYVIGLPIQLPTYPFIDNYTKHTYKAGTQNWDIAQDTKNRIYFANNYGVLQFDGYNWNLCRVSNNSIVRTIEHMGNDTLMVGAYNEFGALYTDEFGTLVFESWLNKIPEDQRDFQEIWRIYKFQGKLIVQSFKLMFIFQDGLLVNTIHPKNSFKYSFLIDNQLYIQDLNEGLFLLSENKLKLLSNHEIYTNEEIWTILPYSDTKLLIGTQNKGFYIYDGTNHIPWESEAQKFMLQHHLFCAIQIKNGNYIFGSIQGGAITTDQNGNIIRHQNTDHGLQNNTVLSLFEDAYLNIWIGLDNGIDYSKTNSPLLQVSKEGGFGMGYASCIANNKLYVGTNQGLYYINLDYDQLIENDFIQLNKSIGQVWNIKTINNIVYCCHNLGLHILKDSSTKSVTDISGVWDIKPIPSQSDFLLFGTYEGIWKLNKTNQSVVKLKGFNESARKMVFLDKNHLLISHGYKGIYKVKINWSTNETSIVDFYNGSKFLPEYYGNEIYKINNQILACTNTGIFEYTDNRFYNLPHWDKIITNGANQVSSILENSNNKIWCFKDGKPYLITYLNSEMYEVLTDPFLPIVNTFPRSFENVLAITNNKYLIGNEDGFILYNNETNNTPANSINLNFSKALYFNYNENKWLPIATLNNSELGKLKYAQNNLQLYFSVPYYQRQELLKIRYRNNKGPWSDWQNGNKIELNNLHEGNYYTDIQCTINQDLVLSETTIVFEISPPFYRTWQMYLVYLAIFFSLTLLVAQISQKRIENVKRFEKIRNERENIKKQLKLKQQAEVAKSEIIKLRNEKLKTDIRHKSKELANTTMSIINKNKVLQQIKDVLASLSKDDIKYRENQKLETLIKKINKEIENQDNWTVFEHNFDKVHENFLKRLKENHSELTPKDLRLAAYLRMNLSSKEIAPLLNISVRSVEISRYRLRKKMNLEHDQNLTEYLIST